MSKKNCPFDYLIFYRTIVPSLLREHCHMWMIYFTKETCTRHKESTQLLWMWYTIAKVTQWYPTSDWVTFWKTVYACTVIYIKAVQLFLRIFKMAWYISNRSCILKKRKIKTRKSNLQWAWATNSAAREACRVFQKRTQPFPPQETRFAAVLVRLRRLSRICKFTTA